MAIGGISGMTSAGAGMPAIDDIAFSVMVLRLQTLDTQLEASIKGQQARIDLGNAIRARKSELEQALATSGASEANDRVDLTNRNVYSFSIDENGDVVSHDEGNLATSVTEDTNGDGQVDVFSVRKHRIDGEIERLQGLLDQVNGDSEIAMMELNRLVNQRQTALQMTTNVLSSMHQSQMGIVNNIGK